MVWDLENNNPLHDGLSLSVHALILWLIALPLDRHPMLQPLACFGEFSANSINFLLCKKWSFGLKNWPKLNLSILRFIFIQYEENGTSLTVSWAVKLLCLTAHSCVAIRALYCVSNTASFSLVFASQMCVPRIMVSLRSSWLTSKFATMVLRGQVG